jgi:ligand-binding SRPBCC domain-containing protein
MFRLKESMHVQAPLERCFLLATHIGLVEQTIGLHPGGGPEFKKSGLIEDGDRVKWTGWKFGLPAFHETLITEYDRPHFFQDSMAKGMFKSFSHDHRFDEVDGQTLMIDIVRFSMPLGPLGKAVGKAVVVPHVLDLLLRRFQLLKRIAESDEWERYLL